MQFSKGHLCPLPLPYLALELFETFGDFYTSRFDQHQPTKSVTFCRVSKSGPESGRKPLALQGILQISR